MCSVDVLLANIVGGSCVFLRFVNGLKSILLKARNYRTDRCLTLSHLLHIHAEEVVKHTLIVLALNSFVDTEEVSRGGKVSVTVFL